MVAEHNRSLLLSFLYGLTGVYNRPAIINQFMQDTVLIQKLANLERALPGYTLLVEEVSAEGAFVSLRAILQAYSPADSPNFFELNLPLVFIFRMVDGKIAEHWLDSGLFDLFEELNSPQFSALPTT